MSNQPPTAQRRYQPVLQPPPKKPQEFRRTTFTYADPKAQKVCVAGDFNKWSPDANPMLRTAGGVWVLQLELTPGKHEFLFTVDGKWVRDPKATLSTPNFHGGINSVVLV